MRGERKSLQRRCGPHRRYMGLAARRSGWKAVVIDCRIVGPRQQDIDEGHVCREGRKSDRRVRKVSVNSRCKGDKRSRRSRRCRRCWSDQVGQERDAVCVDGNNANFVAQPTMLKSQPCSRRRGWQACGARVDENDRKEQPNRRRAPHGVSTSRRQAIFPLTDPI